MLGEFCLNTVVLRASSRVHFSLVPLEGVGLEPGRARPLNLYSESVEDALGATHRLSGGGGGPSCPMAPAQVPWSKSVPESGCFHAMAVVGHGGYSDLSHWRRDVQAPPFHMVAWASSQHGSLLAVKCLYMAADFQRLKAEAARFLYKRQNWPHVTLTSFSWPKQLRSGQVSGREMDPTSWWRGSDCRRLRRQPRAVPTHFCLQHVRVFMDLCLPQPHATMNAFSTCMFLKSKKRSVPQYPYVQRDTPTQPDPQARAPQWPRNPEL